jgi:hypothetical protein
MASSSTVAEKVLARNKQKGKNSFEEESEREL